MSMRPPTFGLVRWVARWTSTIRAPAATTECWRRRLTNPSCKSSVWTMRAASTWTLRPMTFPQKWRVSKSSGPRWWTGWSAGWLCKHPPASVSAWCACSVPDFRRTPGSGTRPGSQGRHPLWQALRPRLHIIAQLPHDLDRLADIRLAAGNDHGGCDRQQPGVELAVACVAFERKLHELRAPVLRIVDELNQPLGRQLIRQPLHALTAGGPHLGDLRHGERAKQREASHEAERAAAPTGDEPRLLAE